VVSYASKYLRDQTFSQFGLLSFALFGWLGVAGSSFGAVILLILSFIKFSEFWGKVHRLPLFWISLGAILYVALLWVFTDPIDQQTSEYAVKYTKSIVYTWLFIIIGWHLSYNIRLIRWLIGLSIFGLILKILIETDWQHIQLFINNRQDFGFSIAGAGLYSALSIWGLSVLSIHLSMKYEGSRRILSLLATMIGIVVLREALVITQARSGWLTIILGIAFVLFLVLIKEKKIYQSLNIKRLVSIFALMLLLLSVLITANHKVLSNRLQDDSGVYSTLLSFDRQQIPYASSAVGARAHMLIYGFNLWLEKPVFGWGVGSSRSLLAQDEIINAGDHPHFHNNYLEILVEQGIVGFAFYLIAFILLMHGLYKAYSEEIVPKDIFYYLNGAWIMVLVWSLADSRMVHADLRFFLLLLCGITFSFILNRGEVSNSASGSSVET